jgi:hypothetical protein
MASGVKRQATTNSLGTKWITELRKKVGDTDLPHLAAPFPIDVMAEVAIHMNEFPADGQRITMDIKRYKREHAAKTAVHATDENTMMDKFGTLRQVDAHVCIAWLDKNCDLSKAEIIAAKKVQKDAPWRMLSFALQIGLNFKMPPLLRNIEIFNRFADARAADCGSRLKDFKAKGGLLATNQLSFKDRIFKVIVNKDKLVEKFVHVPSGSECKVPDGAHVSLSHAFDGFWCVLDASHQLKPQPAVKIIKYFPADVNLGHVLAKPTQASARHFEEMALNAKNAWMLTLAGSASSSSVVTERMGIVTDLKKSEQEKKQATMKAVRAKTMLTVEQNLKTRLTSVA